MKKYVDLFDALANYIEDEGDGCIVTQFKQQGSHSYFMHQEDLGNGYQEVRVYQMPNAAVLKIAKSIGFEGDQHSFDDDMYCRLLDALEQYRLVTFE